MSDLIDTTEMYLRTIYELGEEGINPMRARIAERLDHSGPTVSQTVARMERDGLVVVSEDRHLELTTQGRERAIRVMRKHRLAECMLVEMLQLPWEDVHSEACRWEHVMSDAVERRVFEKLGNPTISPFGNPIPGLEELADGPPSTDVGLDGLQLLAEVLDERPRNVTLRRLAEPIQTEYPTMRRLREVGAFPDAEIEVALVGDMIRLGPSSEVFPRDIANYIWIAADE